MKKILQKIFSVFNGPNPRRKIRARKSRGQSLVEVAISFPLLIMLFSGMVEFGFMLNTYLSLLDATRQTARYFSNLNPFVTIDESTDPPTVVDDMQFYNLAGLMIVDILNPPTDEFARSIELDPSRDDIVISVIRVSVSDATDTITDIERYPQGQPEDYFQYFDNQLSVYADNAKLTNLITKNGTDPVRTGILIIEIYYGYEGVLKLPWVEMFMDTVMLHADTLMPLVSAKPPRTP